MGQLQKPKKAARPVSPWLRRLATRPCARRRRSGSRRAGPLALAEELLCCSASGKTGEHAGNGLCLQEVSSTFQALFLD